MELIDLGNSEALKKLKKKKVRYDTRPEWIFEVSEKPPSVIVEHFREKHVISEAELRKIGVYLGEFRMKGSMMGASFSLFYDFGRYTWLPKKMYKRFLKAVCQALGKRYYPFMIDSVTPVKFPKSKLRFPMKMAWDIAMKKAKELEERNQRTGGFIEYLEALAKVEKEMKEK